METWLEYLELLDVVGLEEAGIYNGSQTQSESKPKTQTKSSDNKSKLIQQIYGWCLQGAGTAPEAPSLSSPPHPVPLHPRELVSHHDFCSTKAKPGSKSSILPKLKRSFKPCPWLPCIKAFGSVVCMFVYTLYLYFVCM